MSNRGSFLPIAALAILVLAMVAAALFMVKPTAAPAGGAPAGGPGLAFSVTTVRTAQGITATVTVTNKGTEALKDLKVTKAALGSMTGAGPLPLLIPKLPQGAATTLVLPFTGTAPAANAPLSLNLDYTYRFGFFGKGSGSCGISSTVP
jgi:hypothetical protein